MDFNGIVSILLVLIIKQPYKKINEECYQEPKKVDGNIQLKNVTFRYGNAHITTSKLMVGKNRAKKVNIVERTSGYTLNVDVVKAG